MKGNCPAPPPRRGRVWEVPQLFPEPLSGGDRNRRRRCSLSPGHPTRAEVQRKGNKVSVPKHCLTRRRGIAVSRRPRYGRAPRAPAQHGDTSRPRPPLGPTEGSSRCGPFGNIWSPNGSSTFRPAPLKAGSAREITGAGFRPGGKGPQTPPPETAEMRVWTGGTTRPRQHMELAGSQPKLVPSRQKERRQLRIATMALTFHTIVILK